jgi:hypothetical protein
MLSNPEFKNVFLKAVNNADLEFAQWSHSFIHHCSDMHNNLIVVKRNLPDVISSWYSVTNESFLLNKNNAWSTSFVLIAELPATSSSLNNLKYYINIIIIIHMWRVQTAASSFRFKPSVLWHSQSLFLNNILLKEKLLTWLKYQAMDVLGNGVRLHLFLIFTSANTIVKSLSLYSSLISPR